MRALTVSAWGTAPTLSKVAIPSPAAGQTQVKMLASGLAQLVKSQAAGTHYSVQGIPLPYIPGIDGVGYAADTKLVYVNLLGGSKDKGGAFAEYAVVDDRAVTAVPVFDGASEELRRELAVKVAALVNPAMSSWMAMKYRAHIDGFRATGQDWNVLILGATSTSGRIAALFARHFGAKSVLGVARDAGALESMRQKGVIDQAIALDKNDVSGTDWSVLQKQEVYPLVVLDYIYGSTALSLMNALPRAASMAEQLAVQWVHIGTLGREPEIALSGPLLRAKNITISGSGPGSWSMKALAKEMPGMIEAIVEVLPAEGWKEEYGVVERGLEDVKEAWEGGKGRTVFVM